MHFCRDAPVQSVQTQNSQNFGLVGSSELHGKVMEIWNFNETDNFAKSENLQNCIGFCANGERRPLRKRIPRKHAREKEAWNCPLRNSTLRNSTLEHSGIPHCATQFHTAKFQRFHRKIPPNPAFQAGGSEFTRV